MKGCREYWVGELAWTAGELARDPPDLLPGPPPEPLPTELNDKLADTDDGLNEMELGLMERPEEADGDGDGELPSEACVRGRR